MAQARGRPISLQVWPSRSLLGGLVSILRLSPYRFVKNLLRGEATKIVKDKIADF